MMIFLFFSIPGLLLSVVVLWLVLLVRTREQQRVRRLLDQRQRRMKERRDHARLRYEAMSAELQSRD